MSRDLTDYTLAQFDIVGCFFINKFYSHLYQIAGAKLAAGEAKTLTDAYRDLIVAYVRGINQPAVYLQTLKELIQYWSSLTTGFQTTITEFEDKILVEFIPPEYFRDFTSKDRETILQKIIFDAVSTLANECVKMSMLSKIIDKHSDESNVTILQRKMVDHFASIRNVYFEKFVQEISKSNRDTSSHVVDALKQECASLVRRCSEAEAQRDKLQKMLAMALDKIDDMKKVHALAQAPTNTPVATPSRYVHTSNNIAQNPEPQRKTPARATPVRPAPSPSSNGRAPPRASPLASTHAQAQVHTSPVVHTLGHAHALTTPMRKTGLSLSDLTARDEPVVVTDMKPTLSILDEFQSALDATTQEENRDVGASGTNADTREDTATANTNVDSEPDSEEEYRRQQEQLERKLQEL